MFNVLLSNHELLLLTLFSFLILFTARQLFIKKKEFIFFYHLCLFGILFILAIGGVQNDGYKRLEEFIFIREK